MSKSILLMNTPNKCEECQLLYHCHKYEDHINMSTKPEWCPLKPLPKKIKVSYGSDEQDWEKGYNSCIEQIMDT